MHVKRTHAIPLRSSATSVRRSYQDVLKKHITSEWSSVSVIYQPHVDRLAWCNSLLNTCVPDFFLLLSATAEKNKRTMQAKQNTDAPLEFTWSLPALLSEREENNPLNAENSPDEWKIWQMKLFQKNDTKLTTSAENSF